MSRTIKAPNTKHQTPKKLQTLEKLQARSAGRGLELGTWDFFGVWSLVFGVSIPGFLWSLVFRSLTSSPRYAGKRLSGRRVVHPTVSSLVPPRCLAKWFQFRHQPG